MIGKVGTSGSVRTLLNYCYYESVLKRQRGKNEDFKLDNVRGEYIYSQNLDVLYLNDGRIDIDTLIAQFEGVTNLNRNCMKPLWHESFSFPLDEIPSNQLLTHIIVDFSKSFGFDARQLIAFRHHDKSHHHFHIIANRLDFFGKKAIKTSCNFKKTNKFCREIEVKYGLTTFKTKNKDRKADETAPIESRIGQPKGFVNMIKHSSFNKHKQIQDGKYTSVFNVSGNTSTETEKDLSKIDSNLLKTESIDSQGIRPIVHEYDQKSPLKR